MSRQSGDALRNADWLCALTYVSGRAAGQGQGASKADQAPDGGGAGGGGAAHVEGPAAAAGKRRGRVVDYCEAHAFKPAQKAKARGAEPWAD